MKPLIIGANGALGTDLVNSLPGAIAAVHADIDIRDGAGVADFLARCQPTHVINTAAYHQVPTCEENFDQAFEVNAIGARNLAIACRRMGIHFCHISTDYVFDGSKAAPYLETDLPAPLNTYAVTKLAGEHMVRAYGGEDHSIVRSCGLYGAIPTRAKGGNFITSMVHLGNTRDRVTVVDDEIVAPTFTRDLAEAIRALLNHGGRGTFHMTQSGQTSWFEFARIIFDRLNLPARLEPISASEFQSKVNRPLYSILDNTRFEDLTHAPMRHWSEALRAHLDDMVRRGLFGVHA